LIHDAEVAQIPALLWFGDSAAEANQIMTSQFTKSILCLCSSKDQLEYLRWRLAIHSLNRSITIYTGISDGNYESAVVLMSKAFLKEDNLLDFCRTLAFKLSSKLAIYKIDPGVEVPDDLQGFVVDSSLFKKLSICDSSEGTSELLATELPQSSALMSEKALSSVIVGKQIGKGQFGKAFLAEFKDKKVVAKQIEVLSSSNERNRFDQAVSILNEIMIAERVSGHPNTGKLLFSSFLKMIDVLN
jgi:hypothetical protein